MALLVEQPAPKFQATALVGGNALELHPGNAFRDISLEDFKGKWVCLFFYPLDFTFVCPTEIVEFGKAYEKFNELNCEILACSTDSKYSHLAWRSGDPQLRHIPYHIIADFTGEVARKYEILKEETGFALRGLYIIDPEGTLQYAVIHPEKVGRSSGEILRVLQALQTGEKTPCNWVAGENTL